MGDAKRRPERAVLLLTGATGSIGSRLLPLLLERGEDVRCLVREPRRLGERRVDVQIALGDLGEMSDPYLVRQALRGVDTVVHLAATIRDQPPHRIEELNGLATVRLLRAAERSGVRALRLLQRPQRLGRAAHPLLPRQVAGRAGGRLLAPRDDDLRPLDRLRPLRPLGHAAAPLLLPAGAAGLRRWARPRFEPIWAADAARCVVAPGCARREAGRYELAGPESLNYDQMSDLVSRAAGRPRPLVHLPLPLVRYGLLAARSIAGEAVFATWEEAELMEVPMVSERGTADAEALGVEPRRMGDVLEDT